MSEMLNISEHPENPQIFDEPPVTHATGVERAQRAVRNLVISEHPENTH